MPYQTIWVEPDLFLEHNGVKVYHSYKNDDFEDPLFYWFCVYPSGDTSYEDDKRDFDVGDLSTRPKGLREASTIVSEAEFAEFIKRAIESGELDNDGRHPVKEVNP